MFPSSFAPVSVVVGCVDGSWGPVEPMANQGALSLRAVGLHYGQVAFEGLRAVSIDGRLHVFRPDLHHRRLARSLERLSMPAVPGPVLGGALAALLDRVAIPEDLGPGWFLYLRPLVVAVDEDWSMSGGRQFELHVLTGWTAPAFHDVPEIRALADSAGRRALSGRAGVVKVPANYGSAMPAQHRARSVGAYTVLWLTPGSRVVEEFTSMNALVVVDGVLHAPAPGPEVLDGVIRRSVLELAGDAGVVTSDEPVVWPHPDRSDGRVSALLATATAVGLVGVEQVAEVSPDGAVQTWRSPADPPVEVAELRRIVDDVLVGRRAEHWWADAPTLAAWPFMDGDSRS
jgi:branched-subunit amino acid aminotransferase/4-amino-4-deoxychorismate lyase